GAPLVRPPARLADEPPGSAAKQPGAPRTPLQQGHRDQDRPCGTRPARPL
ncbi:MAG: hypothetical protein AVDCRST_MAG48-3332, partial [uncultured Friedmanniella sp.]